MIKIGNEMRDHLNVCPLRTALIRDLTTAEFLDPELIDIIKEKAGDSAARAYAEGALRRMSDETARRSKSCFPADIYEKCKENLSKMIFYPIPSNIDVRELEHQNELVVGNLKDDTILTHAKVRMCTFTKEIINDELYLVPDIELYYDCLEEAIGLLSKDLGEYADFFDMAKKTIDMYNEFLEENGKTDHRLIDVFQIVYECGNKVWEEIKKRDERAISEYFVSKMI